MTSFVGRRDETADVQRLLSEGRLVTLVGPAGVGKTRLAVQVGAHLARTFADGVWLVELAALHDGALLARTVLQALEIRDIGGREPRQVLAEYVRGRRMLLILDNCEHLVTGCAELVGTLLDDVDSARILATSRELLRVPGEAVLAVGPLAFPDPATPAGRPRPYSAVTLFAERATAASYAFALGPDNEALVGEVCRRLDGLPLALELAAVRLRSLSLEQLLGRLDNRFALLTGRRAGSAQERVLQAAVEWSFDLCTAAEKTVWAQVSVFTGGFGPVAVGEVCGAAGIDRETLPGVLDALVAKSILVPEERSGPVRYRLLETLREYGLGRLRESGAEAALRERHARWYLDLAERGEREWSGPYDLDWLERMRAEQANLRTALDFYLTHDDPEHGALRLATGLWFFWVNTRAVTEAAYWLGRALTRDTAANRYRARALVVAAHVAVHRFDFGAADRLLDEAAELAGRIGDPETMARITCRRASMAMFRGELDIALELGEEALSWYREFGRADDVNALLAQLTLASIRLFQGDLPAARDLGERCRATCVARGEHTYLAYVLLHLARTAWTGGELGRATGYARDVLRLCRASVQPAILGYAVDLLAWTAGSGGRYERAAVLLGAQSEMLRTFGPSLSGSVLSVRPRLDCEARTRAALGAAAYEAAYRRGTGMDLEEAVGYALDEQVPTGLTRREREVALLVAEGMSNREIAQRLVISQRTAESHIEHVLRKLGYASRAEIAGWARAGSHA